jgi:hypothetical protein
MFIAAIYDSCIRDAVNDILDQIIPINSDVGKLWKVLMLFRISHFVLLDLNERFFYLGELFRQVSATPLASEFVI